VAETVNITNFHIEEIKEFESLSERTKNVCLKGSLDTLYKILSYYLKNGNFKKIRNCGEKTNLELIALAEKYISEYTISLESLEMTDENILFERFKFFCFENFGIPSQDTEIYRTFFYQKKFPLFKYILEILKQVFNEREYFIFEHNFGFMLSKNKMTLQSIGDIYNITRERIRQISQMIPYKLEETVTRFAREQDYLKNYYNYKLDIKDDYILINNATAEKINEKEELEFTPKFYSLIFSILNAKTYSMFQEKELTYENYFLVKNDLYKSFAFDQYYNDLAERLSQRIEESYSEKYDQLLKKYVKVNDKDIFNRIKPLCKDIAMLELDIAFDGNDIIFKRNTLIKLSEYIIEIIEDKGSPMKLKDIHEELAARTSKAPHNIESLRSSILSIENIVAIGKTSTYSLKTWTEIKTGTIKEMVRDYLEQYDEPRHISDVTEYVTKYRDTNDKNILSNLKLDKTGKFVFFKKSYIGLGSKKYKRLSGKYGQLKLL